MSGERAAAETDRSDPGLPGGCVRMRPIVQLAGSPETFAVIIVPRRRVGHAVSPKCLEPLPTRFNGRRVPLPLFVSSADLPSS